MANVPLKDEKLPRTKKKGFLEGQGYRPESLHDTTTEKEYIGTYKGIDEQITDHSGKKRPRPEPLDTQTKTKQDIRKQEKEFKSTKLKKDSAENKMVYRIAFILLVIGIVILLIGFSISYQNYIEFQSQFRTIEESGYYLLTDLQNYPGLTHESDTTGQTWDKNKFLNIGPKEIENELDPGVNFLVEIQDISQYQIKYNRTVENGLAWTNLDLSNLNLESISNKFTITSYANIYVSSNEHHLVKIIVYVWE